MGQRILLFIICIIGIQIISEKTDFNLFTVQEKVVLDTSIKLVAIIVRLINTHVFEAKSVSKKGFAKVRTSEDQDVIIKALNIACANNKRKLSYVVGILKIWVNDSLQTVEEIDSFYVSQNCA